MASIGNWVENGFITKDLYAPFSVEKDKDYRDNLRKKYKLLKKQAETAGADDESIKIIKKYSDKVLEALGNYYKGRISTAHQQINLSFAIVCTKKDCVILKNA